jgi:hypothetical protein
MKVNIVIIKRNQEVKTINIEKNNINLPYLHKLLNNKNILKNLKVLHVWSMGDYNIETYGYVDGKERMINRLELPPPIDQNLYYNELIFVCKNKENNIINFDDYKFEEFYNEIFEGFEDLIDDEEDFINDDQYISDGGFVILDE